MIMNYLLDTTILAPDKLTISLKVAPWRKEEEGERGWMSEEGMVRRVGMERR